jgi:dephospho-CoA kinase
VIVGLTGGIAVGKSTVASILQDLGAEVVDADQVARDVAAPGTVGLSSIVAVFGEDMLLPSGALDREALGKAIVVDKNARSRLEAITHPLIRTQIAKRAQAALLAGAAVVFVEAALLVETGSAKHYPHLWVVVCNRALQISRLMSRKGCDRTTAEAWIDSQMPLDKKAAHATQIIENSGSHSDLTEAVNHAYTTLMAQQTGQG